MSLSSLEWTKSATTGTPPAGVMNYGTAVIGGDVIMITSVAIMNCTYELNTDTKVWRNIPCTDGEMEKYGCGFISYSCQTKDNLLPIGYNRDRNNLIKQHVQPGSLYVCTYIYIYIYIWYTR